MYNIISFKIYEQFFYVFEISKLGGKKSAT